MALFYHFTSIKRQALSHRTPAENFFGLQQLLTLYMLCTIPCVSIHPYSMTRCNFSLVDVINLKFRWAFEVSHIDKIKQRKAAQERNADVPHSYLSLLLMQNSHGNTIQWSNKKCQKMCSSDLGILIHEQFLLPVSYGIQWQTWSAQINFFLPLNKLTKNCLFDWKRMVVRPP